MAWTEADFQLAYRLRVRQPGAQDHGQIVGYGRRFAQQFQNPQTDTLDFYISRLQALLGSGVVTNNRSVLVVGCGYGFLLEVAIAFGLVLENVWGIDTSAYIHANKAVEADVAIASHILDYDLTSPTILNDLKPHIGGNGKFNVVVTENVIETIPPAEVQVFLDACDNVQQGTGGVAHIVMCQQPDIVEGGQTIIDTKPPKWETLGMTWQLHAQWAALSPSHYWFDECNNLVVLGGA